MAGCSSSATTPGWSRARRAPSWTISISSPSKTCALRECCAPPRPVVDRALLAAAFRNLVAHQYGALDWSRVYALAGSDLGDLDAFCARLAGQALS
jgi:hypothetical protein